MVFSATHLHVDYPDLENSTKILCKPLQVFVSLVFTLLNSTNLGHPSVDTSQHTLKLAGTDTHSEKSCLIEATSLADLIVHFKVLVSHGCQRNLPTLFYMIFSVHSTEARIRILRDSAFSERNIQFNIPWKEVVGKKYRPKH